MFTGIVEAIGTVTSLTPAATGTTLTLAVPATSTLLSDAKPGDSISVNGACLTITSLPTPHSFTLGLAPETLRRTNLGALSAGGAVNLEAALLPHTRLGGHFLQGHVDTVAVVAERRPDGEAVVLRFAPRDGGVMRYVVEKGFVGVDGASLTVTECGEGWFEVMLVAYTQEKIVTAGKEVGEEVNVEVDMVGKYVEKSVRAYFEGAEGTGGRVLEAMVEKIVEEKLKGR